MLKKILTAKMKRLFPEIDTDKQKVKKYISTYKSLLPYLYEDIVEIYEIKEQLYKKLTPMLSKSQGGSFNMAICTFFQDPIFHPTLEKNIIEKVNYVTNNNSQIPLISPKERCEMFKKYMETVDKKFDHVNTAINIEYECVYYRRNNYPSITLEAKIVVTT